MLEIQKNLFSDYPSEIGLVSFFISHGGGGGNRRHIRGGIEGYPRDTVLHGLVAIVVSSYRRGGFDLGLLSVPRISFNLLIHLVLVSPFSMYRISTWLLLGIYTIFSYHFIRCQFFAFGIMLTAF